MRARQDRQDATRRSLKWSMGDRLMMMFSVVHAGQVYRITYPVRVPVTSGYAFTVFILFRFLGIFTGAGSFFLTFFFKKKSR